MKIKIAPSLLSANFSRLKKEIEMLESSGADILHLDVMDGHFVPNLTFGPPVIKEIKKCTNLPLDVHLMVTNPGSYLENLSDIGVEYISFHAETEFHSHRLIQQIKAKGIKAGLAINPGTDIQIIEPLKNILDFVLIMSVNPGFGGQTFIDDTYVKLSKLNKILSNSDSPKHIEIEVDGGVNDKNADSLKKLNVNMLVAGSYILGKEDYATAIRSLR